MTIQSRLRYARRLLLLAGAALALTAAALASVGTGAPVARAASSLPCDIYASGGTPCVAAYSTTRALYASYNGPLYQVQRSSDGSYLNIGLLAAGGDANAAPQASFCAGTTCTITKIYDQSCQPQRPADLLGRVLEGPGPQRVGHRGERDGPADHDRRQPGLRDQEHAGHRLPGRQHQRADRLPARGRLHGDVLEPVQQPVLLRLRQRRDVAHRHRQRPHERDRMGQRLLVRRVHRTRAVGGSRPGKRHVQHQYRPQQREQPRSELPVRQRLGEEQRHQQLHPQVRQRHQRRPDHHLVRLAAERLLPDARGGRHPARHRRRQQQRRLRRVLRGGHHQRLPVRRDRERGPGRAHHGRLRAAAGGGAPTGPITSGAQHRASASTTAACPPPTATRSRCGTATGGANQRGPSSPTAPCRSTASAWTSPAPTTATAP